MITPRPALRALPPYVPGQSIEAVMQRFGLQRVIKLASNENPLGCPVPASVVMAGVSGAHRYPSDPQRLRDTLAHLHGVSSDSILLGNGSDELLQIIALSVLSPGDHVLTAKETFSEYRFVTTLAGATLTEVPLVHHTYDVPGLLAHLTPATRLVYIANPNNPTGTILGRSAIHDLMTALPPDVLVVFDQAYADYVTHPDWMPLHEVLAFQNVVVTRTFSKLYGLAAFRLGYAIASPSVIQVLQLAKPPFNVNALALVAGQSVLGMPDFISQSLSLNQTGMQWLARSLASRGMTVVPSEANFLCVHVGADAPEMTHFLLTQGIIIRHLAGFGMPEYVRISIGTPEELQQCVDAIDHFLSDRQGTGTISP